MAKILLFAALALVLWRMLVGRWPWEKKIPLADPATERARALLKVGRNASRAEISAAHKRLLTSVHPDKGGTNEQVYEADQARDLLLRQLPEN